VAVVTLVVVVMEMQVHRTPAVVTRRILSVVAETVVVAVVVLVVAV
jgi:hypothetical protein